MIAADTETFPFGPHQVSPRVVCLSAWNEEAQEVVGNADPLRTYVSFLLETQETVWHNGAYDLACIAGTFPDLITLIFEALDEGRIHDTLIREKLWNLGTHGNLDYQEIAEGVHRDLNYSLADLAKKHAGLDLSAYKDEESDAYVRTSYGEMDGVPASDYPKEFYDYSLLDARATYEVWEAQEAGKEFYKPAALHVKAAFCLQLMTSWGISVDTVEKEKLQARVLRAISPRTLPLIYQAGLVIPAQGPQPHKGGAKEHVEGCKRKGCECPVKMSKPQPERVAKKDALIPYVEKIWKERGLEPRLTDKGNISCKGDILADLSLYDPAGVLDQFVIRERLSKLKTSYFPAMEWPYASGQTADRVHPRYDPLKKTGRVSGRGNTKQGFARGKVHYPSVAVQQAAGAIQLKGEPFLVEGEEIRMRHCYVPAPGHWLLACDYKAMELVSLAQTILNTYGRSRLAEQINRGWDPHCVLGGVLAFEYSHEFRAFAGAPPRGGQDDLVSWCYKKFMDFKKVDGKLWKHFRTFAKPVGLGYPGGLGIKTMVGLCGQRGIKTTEAQAKEIRQIWLKVYPNMRHYLFTQTKKAITGKRFGRDVRTYVTPAGMVRAGCSHTEWANGNALQSPGAEGMKEAMFLVVRECFDPTSESVLYGNCRPLVNMHDELLLEVRIEAADACTKQVKHLMEAGMRKIMVDVAVTAEPALMKRWDKRAWTIHEDGEYKLWTEEML